MATSSGFVPANAFYEIRKELDANDVVFDRFRCNMKQFKAEVFVVKLRYE
jgi:hypothetical protein